MIKNNNNNKLFLNQGNKELKKLEGIYLFNIKYMN